MDRLKQQFQEIQQQLAGLNASQRMLALSLVAIVAVTVIWWTGQAATGERVRLLEQSLSPEQLGEIRQTLSRNDIEAVVEGDRIMVLATHRDEAMSLLALERKLPGDLTRHFDKAIGRIGSFDPHKKIDLTILTARQDELAANISRWPGVRNAKVHVSEKYKKQIGGDILPTAGVTLQTTGGVDQPRQLAEAASHYVAAGFAMLDAQNVEVIIDGRHISVTHEDSVAGGGNSLLELQAAAERHWETKLLTVLSHIPGLRATVSVSVQNDTRRTVTEQIDPDSKVVIPLQTREESDVEEGGSDDWGQAGLLPNTALSVDSGANTGDSRQKRVTEETNLVEVGRTREERFSRGGQTVPTSCTVSLPLSYVRTEWARRSGSSGDVEPTPEQLRDYENVVREEITRAAGSLLGTVEDGRITVVTYADEGLLIGDPTVGIATSEAAAGPLANVSGYVDQFGRPAAVIGLAVAALVLVSSLARRGPAQATSQSLGAFSPADFAALSPKRPTNPEDEIADAGAADALLVGQEIAEEQLQAGQMVDQVQTLVKENPEAAAGLIKRWISAS
ncbi:MAG: flagellar M-ring protein FliF C-terminal domain-containing protein [Planctomycetota bacterium]